MKVVVLRAFALVLFVGTASCVPGYCAEQGAGPASPTLGTSKRGQGHGHGLGEVATDDLICGPRCVQEVLRYYGRNEDDLIDLVREIQWPHIEQGATLDAIDKALQKRGVYTFAMQLDTAAELDWPFPVITHLEDERGGIGHYIVQCSSTLQKGSPTSATYHPSGAVLLTSLTAIATPDAAVRRRGFAVAWYGCFFIVVGGSAIVFAVFGNRRLATVVWACLQKEKEVSHEDRIV